MFVVEVRHEGLNKFRVIRGTDKWVLAEKARVQTAAWEEQWVRKSSTAQRQTFLWNSKTEAASKTAKAEADRQTLSNLLSAAIAKPSPSWDVLKRWPPFTKPRPLQPVPREYPAKPDPDGSDYTVKKSFFERILPSLGRSKIGAAAERLAVAMSGWQSDCGWIDSANNDMRLSYSASISAWEQCRKQHEERLVADHAIIDAKTLDYQRSEPTAIIEFLDLVLSESNYPDYFPDGWDIDYLPETRTAIVELRLPSLDDIPSVKETRFISSKNMIEDVQLKSSVLNALYDSAVYQVCLQTLYEVFASDTASAIEHAAFNGWVQYVDRSSGHETRACIMSVHTSKEVFKALNLSQVDPKTCFRSLKGVGSSQLHAMAAIAPILKLNREDRRFIASVDVESSLDEGVNLAAINWQDFEYLIRQVFEREFSESGGEVKVTQASRDGGVDAVAFDPDPIRGGKIVIQAKRYTNTVGVSAVRDLYGTVMNEGATKGILVTTSSYGPDAYNFAKDKPLTLMDGSNLLHLLGKHGHNVRIDLAEAKRMAQKHGH